MHVLIVMSIETPSPSRPRWWLALGGALGIFGIAALWPLRELGQVCIMIYPTPPGCGSAAPQVAVYTGIALIIGLVSAMVVLYATQTKPRTAIILLSAGVVLVVAVSIAVVALSQTGLWYAPQPYPPVIVN
jgi:hypothetical protein